MSGESILIVDDNPANLKLARVLLRGEGYEVSVANDASEALESLAAHVPRMILMDIQLPDVDGLELTRRLRTDPAYDEVIIVALTAYAMRGDEAKAFAAGCDGYITKPIEPARIPQTIATYLAQGRRPMPVRG